MGFSTLKAKLKGAQGQSLVAAWAVGQDVLRVCQDALKLGFLKEVVLTGPSGEIKKALEEGRLDPGSFSIVEARTPGEGAALAVDLVRRGRSSILMKGHLQTGVLLRAVLHKEAGIRAQELLSHVAVLELPEKRLVLLTDGGMNIKPDLKQKFLILNNAVEFAWSLDLREPKTAVLASLESVNPQMEDTVHAAALTLMGQRGQFSKPTLVDGPLAFDNAYSQEAARQKGLISPVAGQADIFLVPELTTGNVLYKALVHVAHLQAAGIIYGASCPIVLTSRTDTPENKLNAIATACRALASG